MSILFPVGTMGTCELCSFSFPRLPSGEVCNRCKKLGAPGLSQATKDAIEEQPQCKGCSACYPFLKGALCGACLEDPSGFPSSSELQQLIFERSREHETRATEQRLGNTITTNSGLKKANEIKEKTAALRKMNKSEVILIETILFFFGKAGGGNPRKAPILPVVNNFKGTDLVATAVLAIQQSLNSEWQRTPATIQDKHGGSRLNLNDAKFGVRVGKSTSMLDLTAKFAQGTLEGLFASLKTNTSLTDSDIRARRIPLGVYAYETLMDSNDDDVEITSTSRSSVRRASTKRTSTNMTPSQSIGSAANAVKTSAKRGLSPPVSAPYTSMYRPAKRPKEIENSSQSDLVSYQTYSFSKVTISVDWEGNTQEINDTDGHKIEVAVDWMEDIGKGATGGYLGQGFSKYAILGKMNDMLYAIFQCKPQCCSDEENSADLRDQLDLLALGQYFASTFENCATTYHVSIPVIRWNFAGSFLGHVPPFKLDADAEKRKKTAGLLYSTFLASPKLDLRPPFVERKFSGGDGSSDNHDDLAMIMNAYAHHVYVDSGGTFVLTDLQGVVGPFPKKDVCLFDPQAHTMDKTAGYFDKGLDGIKAWFDSHKCNVYCRRLDLWYRQLGLGQVEKGDKNGGKSPKVNWRKQASPRQKFHLN